MASGKKSRAIRNARGSVVSQRSIPWMGIAAVTVVLLVAGVVFGYAFNRWSDRQETRSAAAAAEQATAAFKPSPQNPDPSKNIPGVQTVQYGGGQHVTPVERVAYDHFPPSGGPHDSVWADCTGTAYKSAVRNENMVHSLEHGAVWIAYNPDKVDQPSVDRLKARVEGKPYTMLSPYPGLDSPISMQSWGHQLKLDRADDPRIDQFITALRQNPNNVYPEVGAPCQTDPSSFNANNPPPFNPNPPAPGPGTVTMDGKGSSLARGEKGVGQ
jgi:hypothetical protein